MCSHVPNSFQVYFYFPTTQICVLLKNTSNSSTYIVLPECSWIWGHSLEHGEPTRSYTLKENFLTEVSVMGDLAP